MLAFPSAVSLLVSFDEEFLYELKAGRLHGNKHWLNNHRLHAAA